MAVHSAAVLDAESKTHRIVPPLWRLVVKKTNPITPLTEIEFGANLYCVHPIAGDVSSFYSLAHHLNGSIRFYGIQVSRENMNAKFGSSIREMGRHYVNAIVNHQPDGPIYLGGWSAGAIVALEMAQQLRAAGRKVPLLIAFDGAPCNTGAAVSYWNPMNVIRQLANLPFWVRDEAKQTGGVRGLITSICYKIRFRTQRSRLASKEDQTLDGRAVENVLASKSWSESQMAFIKAFYVALKTYKADKYEGNVLAIESRTQPLMYLRQVGAAWRKINPESKVIKLNSNHEGIFREPLLSTLAQLVADHISAGCESSKAPATQPASRRRISPSQGDGAYQTGQNQSAPTA